MGISIERRMRPHLDAMWAERDEIVQRVSRAVTTGVPSYATTPSSEVWIGMTRILERAAHGNPFAAATEEDRLAALGTGVQGAGAGIAVDDLVTAVLLGAREVEDDVLDRAARAGTGPADLLAASRRARVWAEQVAVWAAQGLLGAGADDVEEHVRHDRLLAELAAGDIEAARGTAVRLGLDLGARWWVVVPEDFVASRGVEPTISSGTTSLRLANHGSIWGTAAGLVPRAPLVPGELVAGVSGPAVIDDLPAALRDATRATRVALRFGRRGAVELADLGLLVALHEDAALAGRLRARWIEPLAADARHDLERTLRAWLARDGRVDAVARDLGVHANTVRNRLARTTRLLGDGWRTPQGRAELWASLQVAE